MKKAFFIVALLLLVAAVFEFHPAVERARIVVPEEIYVGKTCDCRCIMDSRPWYSRFNYWFWIWIISVPVIIFSIKPTAPKWQRALRTLIAIGFCYVAVVLATRLMWDIRNGPFSVVSDYPWQKSWDDPGVECANIADSSGGFVVIFGWFYAVIYTGWWEIIWGRYHLHKTKLIDKNYKRDWINKIVVFISVVLTLIVFLYVGGSILYVTFGT